MTGPVILGYDYGLLLELVGCVENALQKANPYKKTYKFETKKALLLLILLRISIVIAFALTF